MANLFGPGGLLGPVAPGLSGAVNPLAFIGSGMATGNMGQSLAQMANIQQAGMQLSLQRQRMAQNAMAQRAANIIAQQKFIAEQQEAQIAAEQRAKALELAKTVEGPQRERAILAAEATPDAFAESFVNQEGVFEAAGPGVADFKDVAGAREKYLKHSKEWQEVRSAYERMAASRPTGAGDISLLIGYMKMLDPGSVVREGEFATAENASGVGAQVRNLYNRIVEGARLTPAQRAEFMAQAQALLKAPLDRQMVRERETQAYGARFNIRPEDITPSGVIGPYREGIPPWTPPVLETAEQASETNPVDAIQAEAQARIEALRQRRAPGYSGRR